MRECTIKPSLLAGDERVYIAQRLSQAIVLAGNERMYWLQLLIASLDASLELLADFANDSHNHRWTSHATRISWRTYVSWVLFCARIILRITIPWAKMALGHTSEIEPLDALCCCRSTFVDTIRMVFTRNTDIHSVIATHLHCTMKQKHEGIQRCISTVAVFIQMCVGPRIQEQALKH